MQYRPEIVRKMYAIFRYWGRWSTLTVRDCYAHPARDLNKETIVYLASKRDILQRHETETVLIAVNGKTAQDEANQFETKEWSAQTKLAVW